jgi:hypothetical protein
VAVGAVALVGALGVSVVGILKSVPASLRLTTSELAPLRYASLGDSRFAEFFSSQARQLEKLAPATGSDGRVVVNLLSLSGGSADGAFGAVYGRCSSAGVRALPLKKKL